MLGNLFPEGLGLMAFVGYVGLGFMIYCVIKENISS